MLVAGSVVSVAAAFGPTWLTRIGIGVAVVAAVVAVVLAWKEIKQNRRQQALELLAQSKAHGARLSEERRHNAAVLDTLTERAKETAKVVDGQRVTIAELRTEVSTLHGDNAYLRGEIRNREAAIGSLRETVRARETELVVLRSADSAGDASGEAEGDAEIHSMPRRVLTETESVWNEIPAADELWTDGSHPTVVDMRTLGSAIVLPNYEVDRQVG